MPWTAPIKERRSGSSPWRAAGRSYIGGPPAVTARLALPGPSGALLAFTAVGSLALAARAGVGPRRARSPTS